MFEKQDLTRKYNKIDALWVTTEKKKTKITSDGQQAFPTAAATVWDLIVFNYLLMQGITESENDPDIWTRKKIDLQPSHSKPLCQY